jgi:predicted ABC-type transport system involved in lysophospholipase L1 biosynthesis ATPase subunit
MVTHNDILAARAARQLRLLDGVVTEVTHAL